MKKKPRVLITNDDGISAPGLKHLWQALAEHCDLCIIAPASEKSGVGLGLTLWKPLHIDKVVWNEQTPAWKVTGTPVDCIRLGMSQLLDQPPDFIVSGINRGSNSGRTLLYSGTVAGVIEGVMRNIPGIAFSCDEYANPQYHQYEKYIYPLVEYFLANPPPTGSFLNVNFPSTEKQGVQGWKLARQGRSLFKEDPSKRLHPDGHSYYWMGGKWEDHEEFEDSDVELLKQGFITVVPIYVQELTHHEYLASRKEHFETLFRP